MTRPVVIIGAGPAGASTALALARRGVDTLLLDRATFPREKACGCCLNRAALVALTRLGADALPRRLGAVPLHRLHLRASGRSASVALPGLAAVSRGAFDAALVDAAVAAGVEFRSGTSGHVRPGGRGVTVRTPDGDIDAVVAVVADGLKGSALGPDEAWTPRIRRGSRMGVAALLDPGAVDVDRGVIEMCCGRHGYAGFVRLEDDRVDLAAALDPRWAKRAGGPAAAIATLLRSAGRNAVDLDATRWMGTGLLTRRRPRVAAAHVFVAGDATGYAEPITGDGMAFALTTGLLLAPLVEHAARDGWTPALARRWTHLHRAAIVRPQWLCRTVSTLVRRPLLTAACVRGLAVMPGLAAPVVALSQRAARCRVGEVAS